MKSYPAMQPFSAATQSSLQIFTAFAEIFLNASEQLFSLNLGTVRNLYEQTSAPLAGADQHSFDKFFSYSMETHQDRLQQAAQYFEQFNALFLQTQVELQELHKQHLGEFTGQLQTLMETMGQYAAATKVDVVDATAPARSRRKAA